MKTIEDEIRPPSKDWLDGMRGRLRIESVSALLSEPEPPLTWLIENIWTDKSRGLIAGHPGVGKTWLALDMLLSVCTGSMCLGRFTVPMALPVLLVEEEASRHNLARRVHALARARGLSDTQLTNFYHMTGQFVKFPKDLKDVSTIVKAKGIKFVVFDSLRRFHSAKENSSDEMQPILDAFAFLGADTGASVALIHHLAKSKDEGGKKPIFERMRGTGDLWAWRDCIIGMEGEEDADTATCSFQFRDAESPMPIQVKRSVGETTGAIRLEATDIVESEEFTAKTELAISFIRAQFGAAFMTAIAKAMGGRKAENLKLLKVMIKRGILVAKEGGKYGTPE